MSRDDPSEDLSGGNAAPSDSAVTADGGRASGRDRDDDDDDDTPDSAVDPDDDARRGEPLVTETGAGTRIWATGWYRVRPRTFVHHELFFDPETVACVYAEESYKSYLLRRSAREREAARVGRRHLDREPARLLDHERSFGIPAADVESVRLRSGSLLFKPKLVVRTPERDHEFYHWRRSQDTSALASTLRDAYSFEVVET